MKFANSLSMISVSLNVLALVAVSTLVAPASASAGDVAFWSEVKGLVARCVVQPVSIDENGQKVYAKLASRCHELRVNRTGAKIIIGDKILQAVLTESEQADGGDLDHVSIRDSFGREVASAKNVLAYGDILLALAGGQYSFPEVTSSR